jgi:methyl-accepting chemotaxis protein
LGKITMCDGISAADLADMATLDPCAYRDLDQIRSIISDAVSQLGAGFEQILSESKAQQQLLVALLTQVDGEATSSGRVSRFVTQSNRLVSDVAESLKQASQRTLRLAEKLGSVDASLRKLTSLTNHVADVSEQIRVLSINAKLEAARACKEGGGFSAVASAVEDLSRNFGSLTQEIRETVVEARATLTEAVTTTQAAAVVDERTAVAARTEVVQLHTDTASLNREMGESLRQMRKIGASVQAGFGRCIRGLQFDDLVRQICIVAQQRVSVCRSILTAASSRAETPGSAVFSSEELHQRLATLKTPQHRSVQQSSVDAGEVELF